MEYCKGILAVFQEFSFDEIIEIIKYQRERDNTDILLRVYQASYAALMGVTFEDFKKEAHRAAQQRTPGAAPSNMTAQEVEEQTEKLFIKYKWEVR